MAAKKPRVGATIIPDLSEKLERLKRGLIADTVPIASRRYPNYKESQMRRSLKSGRFATFGPLRVRSKPFRQAVCRYAPPYYFWHNEYMRTKKLKPLVPADIVKTDPTEADPDGDVACIWCDERVPFDDYTHHKAKQCKKRSQFKGWGYYQCFICRDGFLDAKSFDEHYDQHFPFQVVGCNQKPSHPIICRDHAKRNKWL